MRFAECDLSELLSSVPQTSDNMHILFKIEAGGYFAIRSWESLFLEYLDVQDCLTSRGAPPLFLRASCYLEPSEGETVLSLYSESGPVIHKAK